MKMNKKVFVYLVLFIVFVAQIAFSGTVTAGSNMQNDAEDAAVQMAGNGNTEDGNEAAGVMLLSATADNEVEPQVELKVVYKNTLTTTGEIIDDFSDNTEKSDFENKAISYCEARVSIYAEPDETSEEIGCMYSRSQADVLEQGEIWSRISSGSVTGYVKNTYLLFGSEADKVAPFIGTRTTVVDAETLEVHASANADSQVIASFYAGEVINSYEEYSGWVLVECSEGYGYVNERGIHSTYDLDTAITIEEEQAYLAEQARIEAERLAAERAAAAKLAQAQSASISVTTNAAMAASTDEAYLLACIIEWEAGWEPYEGKLAVANVVLNRVRSTRFRQNTITDVIYAPGQFSGVLDGNGNISERFAALLAAGPSHDDSYTAAQEALSGVNNIGDYMFFISVKKANYARYTQYTVINNHCFYAY